MYRTSISFVLFFIFGLNLVNADWGIKLGDHCTQCDHSMLRFITAAHESWKFCQTKSSVSIIADPEKSKGRATGGSLGNNAYVFSQNTFRLIKSDHKIFVLCTTYLFKLGYSSVDFAMQAVDGLLELRILTPVTDCQDNPGFNKFAKLIHENSLSGLNEVPDSGPSYEWMLEYLSPSTPYITFKSCSKEGCRTVIEIELPLKGAISKSQMSSAFDPSQIVDYSTLIKHEQKSKPQHHKGIICSFN